MKTKVITFLCIIISLPLFAEVKILSTASWYPTISGSWTQDGGLTYNNTVWGDTYYNPNWQDMSKSSNIEFKTIIRYFYLKPDSPRDWSLSLPITNLNAEKGYSYWAKSSPSKKQKASQIYWAIVIGYKENGNNRSTNIWLKRSNEEYYSSGYEAYGSEQYISYSVDGGSWKECVNSYPSCAPNKSPTFCIETKTYGYTSISWGGVTITDFSSYLQELTYIQILVGTQAKIQIGRPYAYGSGVNANNIYDASDLIQQENYLAAKNKLYRTNNLYYEKPAYNLAFCYLALGEFDKSIEMCNALIKYNGENVSFAYAIRGFAREGMGQKLDALDDYQRAGATDEYNRLYNEIYKPKQQRQTKPRQQTTQPTKPALTK